MTEVDLRNEGRGAGVDLMLGVCQQVGYRVPGYMARELRRDMKCSRGTMERFFQTVAIEHSIDGVARGIDRPRGQLIVVCWPAERQGREVFIPRLYELPWMVPEADCQMMGYELSKMVQ